MKPNGYKIVSEILNESATSRWIDRVSKMPNQNKARQLLKRFMYDHASINRNDKISYPVNALVVGKQEPVKQALRVFHNPNSTINDLSSAAKTISRIHSEVTPLQSLSKLSSDEMGFRKYANIPSSSFGSYAKRTNKDPNELVDITHGGGKQHLKDFLSGRKKGYGLESGNDIGIQVSPQDSGNPTMKRASYYASRAASENFDEPAVLKAQIKRKYLKGAPNEYEAGLPHYNRKHLKNVRVSSVAVDSK
jgi:hypothetical protein